MGHDGSVGLDERQAQIVLHSHRVPAFMHESMVEETQQREVFDLGLAAVTPVDDVMAFPELLAVTARERAGHVALFKCPPHPRWHRHEVSCRIQ